MSLDVDLRLLAAVQYGLVSRRQARQLGVGASGVTSRVLHSDWEAASPRVLRLVGAPASLRQLLLLAVLDAGPGAVVSHGSAATLWQLPGFSFRTVDVSRPRSRSNRPAVVGVAHHPKALHPNHITERLGIPVTTLPRTLLDLAAQIHPARLARVVDSVVSKSPSLLLGLHNLTDELGASGRGGVAAMRAVLAQRPPGFIPTASGLEGRFARILAGADEPPLERQVDLGGHEWVGRVDFLDRAHRIVVEVDSGVHHTSSLDRAHDLLRDCRLREAGWLDVVRIPEEEVWHRPQAALARLREARRRAVPVLVAETRSSA